MLDTSYFMEFRSIVRSYTSVVPEVRFSYIKLHKEFSVTSTVDCFESSR